MANSSTGVWIGPEAGAAFQATVNLTGISNGVCLRTSCVLLMNVGAWGSSASLTVTIDVQGAHPTSGAWACCHTPHDHCTAFLTCRALRPCVLPCLNARDESLPRCADTFTDSNVWAPAGQTVNAAYALRVNIDPSTNPTSATLQVQWKKTGNDSGNITFQTLTVIETN